MSMRKHTILRIVAGKLFLPYILLFGLYVQFHGDFGPGGGFQAGVIFAAGIVTYALIFGLEAAQKAVPSDVVETLIPLGVLIYAGTGVACMVSGGNFLEYNVLASDPHHGQHYGILLVELGVGITVAAVMVAIFYAFARRGESS
jgi:multicomponent Na+:H+ antiporter subunit B